MGAVGAGPADAEATEGAATAEALTPAGAAMVAALAMVEAQTASPRWRRRTA
jgi:hypothetical protein